MRILCLADEESKYLWDYYQPGRLRDYDLIISCGDLKPEYLSFIATMASAPVLYVHGNHDGRYEKRPPEGCICIEDKVLKVAGLRIVGLGGSRLYSGGPHQYSERQMKKRMGKLWWKLRRMGGADLVVTHAPPAGCGDGEDIAHRGFGAFLPFLQKYRPKHLIHGHVHMSYGADLPRVHTYEDTTVINVCERYVLDLPEYPVEGVLCL